MPNGIEFCSVGFKGNDGIDYLIQAYGKEALELHNEAWMIKFSMTMFPQVV
jgi:hypothetical protein